ncbi:MAG: metallophosphoesterase [Planctomycetes bacterium]|nr:metallophosphoesterase [Planctomycetota bacterium]
MTATAWPWRRAAIAGACLLGSLLLYGYARDRAFVARPYLAEPAAGHVVVRGITKNPTRWTAVPLTPGSPHGEEAAPTRLHQIEFSRLPADRIVEIQILEDGNPVQGGKLRFKTEPGPAAATFDFIVVGDSGGHPDRVLEMFGATPAQGAKKRPDRLVKWMSEARPQLLLHAGDVTYPKGSRDDYARAFFRPFEPLIATAPVVAAPGNHDLKTEDGAPFLDVFRHSNAPPLSEGKYYSFDYGPMHVSVLDSNEEDFELLDNQSRWLRADLRAAKRPWKIVLCHVPLLFNCNDQRARHSPRQVAICDALRVICEVEGVSVVFAGHRHWYERSLPTNGITQIITGGGGDELDDYRKFGVGTYARAESYFHFVHGRVNGDVLTIDAIRDTGENFEDPGGARILRRR